MTDEFDENSSLREGREGEGVEEIIKEGSDVMAVFRYSLHCDGCIVDKE